MSEKENNSVKIELNPKSIVQNEVVGDSKEELPSRQR